MECAERQPCLNEGAAVTLRVKLGWHAGMLECCCLVWHGIPIRMAEAVPSWSSTRGNTECSSSSDTQALEAAKDAITGLAIGACFRRCSSKIETRI